MNKIRIAFGYLAYPFALAHYFRRALERRNDIELFTFGAFYGQFTPWNGGMNIPMKYENKVDLALPPQLTRPSWEVIKNQLPWTPDLVLTVDAGFHLATKPDVPYANVVTDPHVLGDWYERVRPLADKFFNMQYSYMQDGDILLPYAFDPSCHFPTTPPEYIERFGDNGVESYKVHHPDTEYDCSLIGLHYPQRNEWVAKLRELGISVNYRIGDIYDEYREENNKAWIGLNWSSLNDVTARVFEIMAMRKVPILNRLEGLKQLGLEEGRHYLGFSDMKEAVAQVQWAKGNRPFAEQIALEAYQFVHKNNHTYDQRAKTILETMGLV